MTNVSFSLCALLLFFCTPHAQGAVPRQYKLELQLSMGGKVVSKPSLMVQEGKKAELSDVNEKTKQGTFLEVVAHHVPSSENNQAFLQFVIGKLNNGKREIIGTPQLMAMENERASMDVVENEKQVFEISALVSRQKDTSGSKVPKKLPPAKKNR